VSDGYDGQVNSLPIVLAGGCSADQQLVVSKVLLKQATWPHFSHSSLSVSLLILLSY